MFSNMSQSQIKGEVDIGVVFSSACPLMVNTYNNLRKIIIMQLLKFTRWYLKQNVRKTDNMTQSYGCNASFV